MILPEQVPEEDSSDLLDEEIATAIPTTNLEDLVYQMMSWLRTVGPDPEIQAHELRRHDPHVYWRVRTPQGTLCLLADWLTAGSKSSRMLYHAK